MSIIFGHEDGESGRPYVISTEGVTYAEALPAAKSCTGCGTLYETCQLAIYMAEVDPTRACCDDCVLGNTHPPEGEDHG
jgi:hypothetical protein